MSSTKPFMSWQQCSNIATAVIKSVKVAKKKESCDCRSQGSGRLYQIAMTNRISSQYSSHNVPLSDHLQLRRRRRRRRHHHHHRLANMQLGHLFTCSGLTHLASQFHGLPCFLLPVGLQPLVF